MGKCCDYSAGMLNKTVLFEEKAQVSDGAGGFTNTWSTVATAPTRAGAKQISNYERMKSQRLENGQSLRLITRYSAAVKENQRVTMKGVVYNIVGINNVEFADKWLEITATGGVAV